MTEYTVEQQKANRDKWVTALRSGEFQQARQTLRTTTDMFCCLGVACEVARREGVIEYAVDPDRGSVYDGNTDVLSSEMEQWLGLEDDCGLLTDEIAYGVDDDGDPKTAGALTELNDYAGYTFAQIADLIDNDGVKVRS